MSQPTFSRQNDSSPETATCTSSPGRGETTATVVESVDDKLDRIAAGLYNLASMLVGEGEPAVRLVEITIASPEVSTCCGDSPAVKKSSRRVLCVSGLRMLAQKRPGVLAAPNGLTPLSTCIDDNDLEAAGVSTEDLEKMIAGPDRARMQSWLDSLPVAQRAVFVLRAMVGLCAEDTAKLLAENGGIAASGWTADGVRHTLRQALCSLASQLIRG